MELQKERKKDKEREKILIKNGGKIGARAEVEKGMNSLKRLGEGGGR